MKSENSATTAASKYQLNEFLRHLSDREIEQRVPLWGCISALWLDTEMTDHDIEEIVKAMRASGFSERELSMIYQFDVAPAVYKNLLTVAGEWAFFDRSWLFTDILKRRRRCRQSAVQRDYLLFMTRFWWTRRRMFRTTDPLWQRCLDAR